ncbi:MAG: hypothetical protein IPN71_09485 [Fibrobacteres bacterium]|nr:hypothetical protein [Fibrobacterota bacterium]
MKFLLRLLSIAIFFLVFSCRSDLSDSVPEEQENSRCEISITTGGTGLLARRSEALGSVVFRLHLVSDVGDSVADSVVVGDGTSGFKSIVLASNRRWTLDVQGFDQYDSILYSGTKAFTVAPNQVQQISMAFDARFSKFKLAFPVPPTVVRWSAAMDGFLWMDQRISADSLPDSLSLFLNHIAASPKGVEHRLLVSAFGIILGQEREIYRADTTLMAFSGRMDTFRLRLKWVGPGTPPDGRLTIQVEGRPVGDIFVKLKYEDVTNPVREFFDSAAGVVYHYKRFQEKEWMLENIGSTCTGCDSGGTRFDSITVSQACPAGWHLPDSSEWRNLIEIAGGISHLKTTTGWQRALEVEWAKETYKMDYNGDDAIGFHVVPTHWEFESLHKASAMLSLSYLWSSTPNCGIILGTDWMESYGGVCAWIDRSASVVRCTRDVKESVQ